MAMFLVAYEPFAESPESADFEIGLQPIGAPLRLLENLWLLRCDANADWIIDEIKHRIGDGLYLVVSEVETGQMKMVRSYQEALPLWNFLSTR